MQFKKVYSFLAIQIFLLPGNVFSQQTRPKIILALSGGGARGLAHIGVLKYFEENHIPIDGIVGTSIGGLVGATYAMGHSIKELEEIISSLNFEELLNLSLNYKDLTLETKKKLRKYPLSINLAKSKNTSLYQAHAISQFFDRLTLLYSHIEDFSQFPIPFKCTATDIVKGESVVLESGLLPKALRATMAIPGLFPPISWGEKLLVDGGVLNNLPSDIARTMGEIVIAVDVSEGLQPTNKLKSVSSILNQTITVMMSQNLKKGREMASICLRPDIQSFGLLEMKKSKDIIQKGYDEAKKMENQLRPLAISDTMWKEYIADKNKKTTLDDTHEIAYIAVHSKDPSVSQWLAKNIQPFIESERTVNLKKLESRLTLALDKVGASRIHYRLIEPADEESITKPNEKYTSTYRSIKQKVYLPNKKLNQPQKTNQDTLNSPNKESKIDDLASGIVNQTPLSSLEGPSNVKNKVQKDLSNSNESISPSKDTSISPNKNAEEGFGKSESLDHSVSSNPSTEGGFGKESSVSNNPVKESTSQSPPNTKEGFGSSESLDHPVSSNPSTEGGFGRETSASDNQSKEPDPQASSNKNVEGGFGGSQVNSSSTNKAQGFGIEVVSVDDTKNKANFSTGMEVTGNKDNVQLNLGSRLTKKNPISTTEIDFNLGSSVHIAYGQRFRFRRSISIKPQAFFDNESNYYKSNLAPYPLLTDRISSYGANVDLNWEMGNRIGLRGRYQFRKVKLPASFIESVNNVMSGAFQTMALKATYDQQNNASIVTNGLKLTGEATYYLSSPKVKYLSVDTKKKSLKLEFQGSYAHPISNKGTVRLNTGIGYVNNNTLPLNELFSLGGPLKLSTFQEGELRGSAYLFTSLGLLYSIKSFSFFPGKNTYVTIWGERGGVGPTRKKIVMNQNLFAGLLVDSSFGPVFLGGSYGANKKLNFHFGIGNFF